MGAGSSLLRRRHARPFTVVSVVVAMLAGVAQTLPAAAATVADSAPSAAVPAVPSPLMGPRVPGMWTKDPTVGDLPAFRSATSRTYPDGRRGLRTVVSTAPVNYRDSGGNWQPIDDSLQASVAPLGHWRNTADSYVADLPGELSQPVSVSVGGDEVSFALRGAAGAGTRSASAMTYPGVLPATTVAYTAAPGELKETLTLADRSAPSRFVYDVALPAGASLVRRAGGLEVVRRDGSRIGTLQAPFVYDAAGPATANYRAVSMTAGPGGTVSVSVDQAWLADPARRFPVTIDPSFTSDTTRTCTIRSDQQFTSSCNQTTFTVGATSTAAFRSLLYFDLSTIPHTVQVTSAQLQLTTSTVTGATPASVAAYPLTGTYTSNVTWVSRGTSSWTTAGGDFTTADGYTRGGISAGSTTYSWYPTRTVQAWAEGSTANGGFLLKEPDESALAQVNVTTSSPSLNVFWVPRVGDRPFYTQVSQRIDDRSSWSVNPATGNAQYSATDLQVAGIGVPFALTRVNNSTGWGGNFGGEWYSSLTDFSLWNSSSSAGGSMSDPGGMVFNGPDGWAAAFTRDSDTGPLVPPPGLNASAAGGPSGGVDITLNQTGVKYSFDSSGALTSVADRNGDTLSIARSGSWDFTVTDTQGRTFTFTQDSIGAGVGAVADNAGGRNLGYAYDSFDNISDYTDATSRTTHYGYNNGGDYGIVSRITTAEGRITKVVYDTSYRVTSMTRVNDTVNDTGPTWTFAYHQNANDAGGNTTVTDPNNHTTTYYYDTHSRVTRVLDALGHDRQSSYTPNSDVDSLTDGLSQVTKLSYDNLNNLTKVQAPDTAGGGAGSGYSTALGYPTPNGGLSDYQPTSATDAQGNTTTYSYTTTGNLWKVTSPQTGSQPYVNAYQGDGTTTCGAKTGQLCSSTDPLGHVTSYGYDASGNLTSITPPAPLGQTTVSPDAVGRPSTVTDGKGQTTRYSYDNDDRITQLRFGGATTCTSADISAGACITYTYDGDGNLTQRADSTGTTGWTYDSQQRVKVKTLPDSTTSTVTYDGIGNALTYSDAGGTVTYTYDAANRLNTLAEPGGSCPANPVTPNSTRCTTFGYDNNNHRTAINYPSGQSDTFGFDTAGRQKSVVAHRPNGLIFASRSYDYSNATSGADAALRSSVTDETGATTTYSYDVLNRLKAAVVPGPAASIAGGTSHTLLLNGDQTVSAWGLNSSGQLGNNTTTNSLVPVAVSTLTAVTAVAAGGSHSLALKSDGTVWAWGLNSSSQLGNNSTTTSKVPIHVPNLTGVTAIAAGASHSLALKSDGTVWAWGLNSSGQLGNNSTTTSKVPIQVPNLTGITAIAAGASHSLALKSDGTVWDWGLNSSGQLGNNTTTTAKVPTQVLNLTGATSIGAGPGANHSLAVRSDGTVWGWGADTYGQLGNNATTNQKLPVQALNVTDAAQVAGGGSHSIIRTNSGAVFSTGRNNVGQLGVGSLVDSHVPVQVTLPAALSVAAGTNHSATVTTTGVSDWGQNTSGQLGNNSTTQATGPVTVAGVTPAVGNVTYGYTYDDVGNRSTATRTGTATSYYGYNNADQMCWTGTTSGTQQLGTTTCAAATIPTGATRYTYDTDGNQTAAGTVNYAYSTKNQTTSIGSATFSYADIGQAERTAVGTTSYTNGLLGVTGRSDGVYITRDPNGNPISLRQGAGGTSTNSYYTLDALGSVIALTDATGNTDTARYTYDPYGNTTTATGTLATTNPYRYATGMVDGTTGLTKLGTRYYDTATGRFTQRDPAGGSHPYLYASADPIDRFDPSGAWSIKFEICRGALFEVCVSGTVELGTWDVSVSASYGLGLGGDTSVSLETGGSPPPLATNYNACLPVGEVLGVPLGLALSVSIPPNGGPISISGGGCAGGNIGLGLKTFSATFR